MTKFALDPHFEAEPQHFADHASLLGWFESRLPSLVCPVCSSGGPFRVGPDPKYPDVNIEHKSREDRQTAVTPVVMAICDNCRYIMLFEREYKTVENERDGND